MTGRELPHLGVPIMKPESQGVGAEVSRVESRDGLGHPSVDQLPPRRENPAVRDLADPIMSEIEPLAPPLQDPATHQLLDSDRGLLLLEPSRPLQ